MNGDWLGPLILLLGWYLGPERKADNHPLAPWHKIGSAAYVYIVNKDPFHTWEVVARAPEVDGATRVLGTIEPSGEAAFKLPYADTKVYLYVNGGFAWMINVDQPGVYHVQQVR